MTSGSDENEIKLARLVAGEQVIHGFNARGQAQLDDTVNTGLPPVSPGHIGPFFADITGNQFPVRGKGHGYTERAVAGKDPYFQGPGGPHQLDQDRH